MEILLVEDLTADTILLREALRDVGLADQLVVAADGREALERLDRAAAPPDLVLLDLNLPGVSGQEVLGRIRQDPRLAAVPVVVLSTSDAPADVDYAYRHRANAYVRKPNGFHALSDVARAIRDFWTRTATLPPPRPASGVR
jgi:CheY-like chemotaxis protein